MNETRTSRLPPEQKPGEVGSEPILRINLEGPPAIVERLLAQLAGSFAPPAQEPEPEQLYLGVAEVAVKTGISAERLRGLVKVGKLTNYNTGGKILLSLAQVRQVLAE